MQVRRGGRKPLVDAIRRLPSVTLLMAPRVIQEFGAIAKQIGMSRMALMVDALEKAGLSYARGLLEGKRRSEERKEKVA